MKNFSERVAVITGAASGIGRAVCVQLAKEGCDLALADVNQDGLREAARGARNLGRKVSTHIVDVSHKSSMEAFSEEVISEHGHVHLLVNNAGVSVTDMVENGNLEDFEWIMGINFWGVVYGCKFFLPYLLEEDEAHIVNVSSLFGLIGFPSQSYYAATKFAVRGFTESLTEELKGANIQVSCVYPGGIKTSLVRDGRFGRGFIGLNQEETVRNFEEKMARTTPEKAADILVKGIKNNNSRILIGPEARWIDRLQRFFPKRCASMLSRSAAKHFQTQQVPNNRPISAGRPIASRPVGR